MYSSTLGHLFASSSASALVTLRQLLSPKPSASASVIFSEPHHGGAPATGLPLPDPPSSSSPQPPAASASAAHAASAQNSPRFRVNVLIVLAPLCDFR